MENANTVSTLNGLFKEVYGELKDLVPENFYLSNAIKFDSANKIGQEYHEPVILSLEGGFSYLGSTGDLAKLQESVAQTMKDARVKSCEMVLKSTISTGAISRSSNDTNSFKRAMRLLIGNMKKSMYHRLESALFYGQEGLGVVESVTVSTPNDSYAVVKLTDASWCTGVWAGTNSHRIEVFNAALSSKKAVAGATDIIIAGYDFEDKTITVQAIDVDGQGVVISSAPFASTDKIFFKGEVVAGGTPVHKNFMGLEKIAKTRGMLFGIDNTNIPLFQGNIYDVQSSVASFAIVEKAASLGVAKGQTSKKATCLVSVPSWSNILIDQAAKRRYSGGEVATLKEGGEALEFYGQTGMIKIVPSTFVKDGLAFVLSEDDLIRIGSSDVTLERPGHEDSPVQELPDHNGYQVRAYSDQCLFTSTPGSVTIVTGLVNEEAEEE